MACLILIFNLISDMPLARVRSTPRRRAGRPAQGDADLREHLLDAALAAFAAEGIRGTSLKAIATRAAA